jgi:ubiquinone/menaquinone biosynthesis C-methylase UbiE
MKRAPTAELLDTDSGTPAEIAASLADLHGINRRFGGVATTEVLVESVPRKLGLSTVSLLEVAAGSGDVLKQVRERLLTRGIDVHFTLLDRAESHLRNGTNAVVADALALPFQDSSFDIVSCNLFVHHLSPSEFVQFVNEALRVCRHAVLINDLVRTPLHLSLVYAATPLFHSRITRHDAPASVRQAYTPQELRQLLAKTDAASVEMSRHYFFRVGVKIWKRPQPHTT